MKQRSFFCMILPVFALLIFSTAAFGGVIYDDFSEPYLSVQKWDRREFVREVSGGKLVSKAANSLGSDIWNNSYLKDSSSIDVIQSDVNVISAVLDTGTDPFSCARVQGYFYNTKPSGGAAGDIWAGVFIGERGNGLEAWWTVLEYLDDDLTVYELKGKDTLIGPGVLEYGTSYTAKVGYDGANGFTFTVNGQVATFSGPVRQRESVTGYKGLATRVFTTGERGTGYISALFDNVYINEAETVYDDFSVGPLDQTKWEHLEVVREIRDGKLRMNFQAGPSFGQDYGDVTIKPTEQSTPYIEAKVAIRTGSQLPLGINGYTCVGGNFYNDSRGPGSALPYNGEEGNVIAWNRLFIGATGNLHAQCFAVRLDTSDGSENTDLFWHGFETPIIYDTNYTLSIELKGATFIFRCNNETYQYNIATPQYEPSTGRTHFLKSYSYPKTSGYFKTSFDDVSLSSLNLDIKANASDGPITVSSSDPVSINISLDPGDQAGTNAEWWIVVQWPFGMFWNYYSYLYPGGWLQGINRCIEMPLTALGSTNVLTTRLPPNDYEFFFVLDDQLDGIPEGKWVNSVKVKVE